MNVTKFNKGNYSKALEVAFLCISEDYEDLSYNEFRSQLKKDRENGRLKESGFTVDLRSNLLIDILEPDE